MTDNQFVYKTVVSVKTEPMEQLGVNTYNKRQDGSQLAALRQRVPGDR